MSKELEQDVGRLRSALSAVQDEAVKLMGKNPSEEIGEGLRLIESIARHGHDVRTHEEKVWK